MLPPPKQELCHKSSRRTTLAYTNQHILELTRVQISIKRHLLGIGIPATSTGLILIEDLAFCAYHFCRVIICLSLIGRYILPTNREFKYQPARSTSDWITHSIRPTYTKKSIKIAKVLCQPPRFFFHSAPSFRRTMSNAPSI